jgi:hypothetical protein
MPVCLIPTGTDFAGANRANSAGRGLGVSDEEIRGLPWPTGSAENSHTFGTLLKANGEDVKPVQELLRRDNIRITL